MLFIADPRIRYEPMTVVTLTIDAAPGGEQPEQSRVRERTNQPLTDHPTGEASAERQGPGGEMAW